MEERAKQEEEEDQGRGGGGEGEEEWKNTRRKTCGGCGRPARVCLCGHLPAAPINTTTTVVILQHPLETRHPLSTVPVLTRCLRNAHVIVGRRLSSGSSPILDSLCSSPCGGRPPALVLFPGADSCDLGDWVSAQFSSRAAGHEIHHEPLYLIVFDATWKHAKEMVRGSLPFLSKFSHQVSLPVDARLEGSSIYDSDLILRKEPFSGCVSTMEAVARSLRLLEVDGDEIEQKLLSVLRAMVAFQACNLKPMKPRPRLVKKSKNSCLLSN
ncbi:uncharacterized protein LOC126410387 isoform X1 [Nymphaea colorata]|nr:uncharacterized protein LOC126410387 isoform X1 [Nymphaea colorata]